MPRLLSWILFLFYFLAGPWPAVPRVAAQATSPSQWPRHNNGLNNVVEWDHYSILVNGKRVFVFSGEMHYWRIPVPELWVDILEKVKAAGFSAFTFYSHWGYHAPNSTTLDFTTGAHDFTPLYKIAKQLGLYVLMRPGPYVNAEASAGGYPLWLTTGAYGTLRNNDSRYTAAWTPYMSEFSQASKEYQVTKGGAAVAFQIENEIGGQWSGSPTNKIANPTAIAYMEQLEAVARANGIDVPLTQNQPNLNTKSWSQDFSPGLGGNIDIDGVDSYPSCWTCDLSACTGTNGAYVPYQVVQYYGYFQSVQPTQPSCMPEFQGGSFNPWGGPQGGCPADIGPDFANLFYRHNIAEGVTAMSLYMFYGGTNWGSLAAPVVATSYDYAAPVAEDRSIAAKYYETKLLALFTKVAHDLTATDRINNSTSLTTNSAILTTELRNPLTNGAFYSTIHATSSSGTLESFLLNVNTSAGLLTIPQKGGSIVLNGYQSKILVTDFKFGLGNLIYSTAEVLTYIITDGVPTLVLWVPTGESGEFYIQGASSGRVTRCTGCSGVSFSADKKGLVVAFTQAAGMSVFDLTWLSLFNLRVIVMDRTYAYKAWVPSISADPSTPENETVLVQGPYLVRGAALSGSTLAVIGDSVVASALEVFAPRSVNKVTWNGRAVATTLTSYGSLLTTLSGPTGADIVLPPLTSWKVADSLPERLTSYNDTGLAWVSANHVTTSNPTKPVTLPVLYVDDYGFHNGIHLFRGYFNGPANGVYLSVQGGTAFGWSAWVNGGFIGSFLGSTALSAGNLSLNFTNATLNAGQNVLFVIQDNHGHDETEGATNPRGILQASLLGGSNFTSWKLAGTAGGDTVQLDPIRGALAEGGLHAERLGWHLPDFDDSQWSSGSPTAVGLAGPGVQFYRTVVPLDIPAGLDVSLSFILSAPASQKVRAQLFVNGYQYGRYNPWIGHQVAFPVPPGILNYAGNNTVGLAVWAQSTEGAKVGLDWRINYVADSSFNVRFDGSYLRPGWTAARLAYA